MNKPSPLKIRLETIFDLYRTLREWGNHPLRALVGAIKLERLAELRYRAGV